MAKRYLAIVPLAALLLWSGLAQAPSAEFTVLARPSAELRPVELWLKDGRPVLHRAWQPITQEDTTLDYELQEAALRRWVDLMLLSAEPALADDPQALLTLAAENLAEKEHARMLQSCPFDPRRAAYCQWRAADEFDLRRLAQDFAERHVGPLAEVGAGLPREIVFVEAVRLEEYDAGRGGLPLFISDPATFFIVADDSLFGYGALIGAERPAPPEGLFWRATAQAAEAALGRVNQSRYVRLAWTYRITRIETPPDQFARRLLVVEPLAAALYADARLTDKLGDLLLAGEAPAADAQEASAEPSAAPVAAHPFQPAEPFVIRLGEITPIPELQRHLNLLVLGQQPELASVPENAQKLAHQNLIGLTAPGSGNQWAGANEFERARSEASYWQSGPAQIIAMAPALPQEVVLVQAAALAEYDFDADRFPITYERGWSPSSEEPLLIQNYFNESLLGSVHVQLVNGQLPDAWDVPEASAQAEFKRYLAAAGTSRGAARRIWIAATVRLTALTVGDQNRAIFTGELVSLALHADAELQSAVAELPVAVSAVEAPAAPDPPAPSVPSVPVQPLAPPASTAGTCTVDAFAGIYDSQYGKIDCRAAGDGLDCCYGGTCDQTIRLERAPDGEKLIGTWKDASDEGYAEFGTTARCDITEGQWAWETDPANTTLYGWSVTGRAP